MMMSRCDDGNEDASRMLGVQCYVMMMRVMLMFQLLVEGLATVLVALQQPVKIYLYLKNLFCAKTVRHLEAKRKRARGQEKSEEVQSGERHGDGDCCLAPQL